MIYSIKYTDDIPENFAGYARAWFIRIRPQYKDDRGLLEHEKVHVSQFWRSFGIHGFWYLLSKSYRLDCEVEAYKKQLKYAENREESRGWFANRISTKYDLDITEEDACKLLE
jgi:hypothetical protein